MQTELRSEVERMEKELHAAMTRNVKAKFDAKLLRGACLYLLNCIDNDTGARDYQLALKKIRQAVAMTKERPA